MNNRFANASQVEEDALQALMQAKDGLINLAKPSKTIGSRLNESSHTVWTFSQARYAIARSNKCHEAIEAAAEIDGDSRVSLLQDFVPRLLFRSFCTRGVDFECRHRRSGELRGMLQAFPLRVLLNAASQNIRAND